MADTLDVDSIERLLQELEAAPEVGVSATTPKAAAAGITPGSASGGKLASNATSPAAASSSAATPHKSAIEFNTWAPQHDDDAPDPMNLFADEAGVARRRKPAAASVSPQLPSPQTLGDRAEQGASVEPEELPPPPPLHYTLMAHEVQPAAGSLPPAVRAGHTLSHLPSRLLVFGGATPKAPATNDCFEFNLETLAWEPAFASRGDPPEPRVHHAATPLPGTSSVLIHGGRSTEGYFLDDAHVYDADAQAWAVVQADGRMPTGRVGHTAVAVGHRVFLFGGRAVRWQDRESDGDVKVTLNNDLFVLDTKRWTWHRFTAAGAERRATTDDPEGSGKHDSGASVTAGVAAHQPHPPKRQFHASCASADGVAIFIHGGMGADGPLDDLWSYAIADKKWTRIEHNGIPRARHAMAYVNDRLVVFGGRIDAAHSTAAAGLVASLAPGAGGWTSHKLYGTEVGAGRSAMGVAACDGVAYVLGGHNPAETPAALGALMRIGLADYDEGTSAVDAVAPLRGLLTGTHCPFDIAIDCGAAQPIGCHAAILAGRAPLFRDALRRCASGPVDAGVRMSQHAVRYSVVKSRHSDGLGIAVTRVDLELFIAYLYTGCILPTAAVDPVAVLSVFATKFSIGHLSGVLRVVSTDIPGGAAGTSPSAAAHNSAAARRAAADAAGVASLRSTLYDMVDDIMTGDAAIRISDTSSITVHLALLAASSGVVRRLAAGLARSREGSFTDPVSHASATTEVALVSGSRTVVLDLGLPPVAAAIRAAVLFLYTKRCDLINDVNALEVLIVADKLRVPTLKMAAERVLARAAPYAGPSELLALLQLASQHKCALLADRVTVAAAQLYREVQREPGFKLLPDEARAGITAVAEQLGAAPGRR